MKPRFVVSLSFCVLAATWLAATPAATETGSAAQNPVRTETEPATTGQEEVPQAEPAKVKALAEKAGVTTEQMTAMRTSGLGWGEIKAAISLAQRISTSGTEPVAFGTALDSVLASRQAGLGWGEIAKANGFKLGDVLGQKSGKGDATTTADPETEGTTTERSGKSGKPEKQVKPEKVVKPERVEKPEKIDKPERPEKPEKVDKPERPEKPEKVDKPEKPEKPEKVDKPEKPEKGNRGATA